MRKSFALLVCVLASNFNVFSQADFYALSQNGVRARIDSLKKVLPILRDFQRVDCLNELGESFLAFDTDTTRAYAEEALKEAEKTDYIKGKAKAYRNLGRAKFVSVEDLSTADKYFTTSLELFEKTRDEPQIAWAWGAVGYSKWVLTKFPEAMEAGKKAEQLFKTLGDTFNLAGTYDLMVAAALQSGNYAKSLEYILKQQDLTGKTDYLGLSQIYSELGDDETAEEYWRRIPPNDGIGEYRYLWIAAYFSHQNKPDSALHYYRLFSNLARPVVESHISGPYYGLGELHRALKNYDSAVFFLKVALRNGKKTNDENSVMRVLLILAKTYNEKGQYDSAIQTAEQLLKMANENGARQYIRDSHFLLYQLYDRLNNKHLAYLNLKKYVAIKDSIDTDLSAQKLAFYKTKSEREEARARIRLLNEEKKLQQQQLKQSAQQKSLLIIGIAVLLFTGTVLFRNILFKRKNEKLESQRRQAELQNKASQLEMQALRAQMNPHFIFNCLSSINRFILKNESEAASDYLTKFSRLIRMVLTNSTKELVTLDEELEMLRLYLEMERLRLKYSFDYNISFQNEIDTENIFIPPLLLQPFTENAIWHGLMNKEGRGNLIVLLTKENNILSCVIEDNGGGRTKAAEIKSKSRENKTSVGLQITKERLARFNHYSDESTFFQVQDLYDNSGASAGTRVILKIRLVEKREQASLIS